MSFILKSAKFGGRDIPLWYPDRDVTENQVNLENCCTILIGKNGIGKSRLLGQICILFDVLSLFGNQNSISSRRKRLLDESADVQIEYLINGHIVNLSVVGHRVSSRIDGKETTDLPSDLVPSRVIATTITPFDKFHISERLRIDEIEDLRKIEKRSFFMVDGEMTRIRSNSSTATSDDYNDDDDGDKPTYRYLGLKNAVGQISNTGQINRVIESLIFSFTKDTKNFSRLSGVFGFLGYQPRIFIDFQFKISKKIIEEYLKPVLPDESFDNSKALLMAALVSKSNVKSSRNGALDYAVNDPNFYRELGEAVFELLSLTSEPGFGVKILTLELDFQERKFISASHNFFKHVTTLKKYGLLRLTDFRLRKLGPDDNDISIKDGSSGEQSIVLTLLGIASEIEDNSLVIIDEPEISLHPEWQEKFIPLMASIFDSYHGCHFVLATHSPQIVARAAETPCVVVTMDDLHVEDAADFFKKSVDFQLAENFNAPGYRNEYLAREGLAAMRLVSQRQTNNDEFSDKVALFRRVRPHLKSDDPIAQMADFLINLSLEGEDSE